MPQPLAQTLAAAPSVAQARYWYDSAARAAATPALPPLDWAHAQPLGEALVLPLHESADLFAHSPGQGFRFLLLAPPPHAGLTGTIVELLLPDKTLAPTDAPALAQAAFAHFRQPASAQPLGQLTGRALFYSPAYHFLTGTTYQHGRATSHSTHLALTTRPTPTPSTAKPTAGSPPPTSNLFACTPIVTDWYDGESGEYITTTYDYSGCQNDGGSGWPPMPPYGGTPYPPTGGGGGGNAPTSSPTLIIIDQSVHNNSKAECVLNKLQNNTQFKELLKNFQNSSRYNASFNMGVITSGATGNCTWNTTTSTANILIDQSKFNIQHSIWGATTFFSRSISCTITTIRYRHIWHTYN